MRHPRFILISLLAGLVGFPVLFFHPMFRQQAAPELGKLLGEQHLDMESCLEELSKYIESAKSPEIADRWGVHHGPSDALSPEVFKDQGQVGQLNTALVYMQEDRLAQALTPLSRYYNVYNKEVKKRVEGGTDIIPADVEGKVLYGIYRYNRAVLLLELAQRNGSEQGKTLLRQALNDLRRAVAAFEQLGEVRNVAGTYWGAGAHAWEGYALEAAHGGLPIAYVYTNLALAYLRLGEADGYPSRNQGYLERENKKYSWGEDALLTPIVNQQVSYALRVKNIRKIQLRSFRLIMALHNLEAAGRGMALGEERDWHQYTIGLLLSHLSHDAASSILPGQAMDFLKLARATSNLDRAVFQLAGKELSLLLLRQGRGQEALVVMETMDVGKMADLMHGPQNEKARLFLDIMQLVSLKRGDFMRVLNHLESRRNSVSNGEMREHHVKLVRILSKGFFKALHHRLKAENASIQGALLADLYKNPLIEGLPIVRGLMVDELIETSQRDPRVAINLWLRDHPSWFLKSKLLGAASFLGWVLYLAWCFKSHRQIAQQIFSTGYGRELA